MQKCLNYMVRFRDVKAVLSANGGNRMGTFAELLQKEGTGIQEEQKEEFKNRIEKLFQAGGMMELENIQLYGKKVVTMKKVPVCGAKRLAGESFIK